MGTLDRELLASQAICRRRIEIVRAWLIQKHEAARHNKSICEARACYLANLSKNGFRVSGSTLQAWERSFRLDGWRGLVDHRRAAHRKNPARSYLPFFYELKRRYLSPGLLSIEASFWLASEAANRQGWDVPMFRQAARYIRREILLFKLTRERSMINRPSNSG
jgi:hypothetical protein